MPFSVAIALKLFVVTFEQSQKYHNWDAFPPPFCGVTIIGPLAKRVGVRTALFFRLLNLDGSQEVFRAAILPFKSHSFYNSIDAPVPGLFGAFSWLLRGFPTVFPVVQQ